MSEVVRLTLVSHAMTEAMAAGRFPTDEPLSALGCRQAAGIRELGAFDAAICGPEARTRQTAELLGLTPESEPLLADLNCGAWRGAALDAVPPAELADWLTDPAYRPPGGESVTELVARVRVWLDMLTQPRQLVAVTHPGVVRAAILVALDAPPKSFWRIDIGPVSRTVMHRRGQVWSLRSSGSSQSGLS